MSMQLLPRQDVSLSFQRKADFSWTVRSFSGFFFPHSHQRQAILMGWSLNLLESWLDWCGKRQSLPTRIHRYSWHWLGNFLKADRPSGWVSFHGYFRFLHQPVQIPSPSKFHWRAYSLSCLLLTKVRSKLQ